MCCYSMFWCQLWHMFRHKLHFLQGELLFGLTNRPMHWSVFYYYLTGCRLDEWKIWKIKQNFVLYIGKNDSALNSLNRTTLKIEFFNLIRYTCEKLCAVPYYKCFSYTGRVLLLGGWQLRANSITINVNYCKFCVSRCTLCHSCFIVCADANCLTCNANGDGTGCEQCAAGYFIDTTGGTPVCTGECVHLYIASSSSY